jgi:hypothetical protein
MPPALAPSVLASSGVKQPQKPGRLPMDYFILPLCLSWWVSGLYFLTPIGLLLDYFDPLNFHGVWTLADCIQFTVNVICAVGFVGMCFRQKWALWLTAITLIVWIGCVVNDLMTRSPDALDALWYAIIFYDSLITASCFYAIWQCSQYEKHSQSEPQSLDCASVAQSNDCGSVWVTQKTGRLPLG